MLNAIADSFSRTQTTQETTSQIKTINTAGGFGSVLYGTVNGDTYRWQGLNTKKNYDPRVRPWYKNAIEKNTIYLSQPYIGSSSGILITTVSKKVVIDGKTTGVTMATLPLTKLNNDILSMKVPADGTAFLLSATGTIISHPDETLGNKPFTDLTKDITASQLISHADSENLFKISINNVSYLTTVALIPGTDWYLILMSQESVLLEPVKTLIKYQLITALVMIILSIFILRSVLFYMLKNLHRVSLALNDIAQGEGDLTVYIETDNNKDEVGKLARSFNRFVKNLHGTISIVNQISNKVFEQAEVNANSSQERQQRISAQQAEVTLVATAMTEMSTTTGDIANNAEETTQTANNTVQTSNDGSVLAQTSQDSIDKLSDEIQNSRILIEELHKQGENIATIVSAINDIAEQTNLLALNASIEAARAGDQGRGFAVVADEVRNLSQRTHASTQEISQMIANLQNATKNAVGGMDLCDKYATQSVEDTGNATRSFATIAESTEEINNMVTQIAAAAEEQAMVSNEINSNTESIKAISDELDESATLDAEQAQQLHQLAKQLMEQVEQFKL